MNTVFRDFVSKWVSTYHGDPVPAGAESLAQLENSFGIVLPQSYLDFMTTVGPVWVPDILDSVVQHESELQALQDIYTVEDAIEQTRAWHAAGMDENLFAFANDSMGNKFCFAMDQCGMPRCMDSPVYFFDHDYDTVDEVAPSFLDFLEGYLALKKTD